MIEINVIFLGPARDLAGTPEAAMALPDHAAITDLEVALSEQFPRLSSALPAIQFAINEQYARRGDLLSPGDTVALIPPVSGGADDPVWCDIVATPISSDCVRTFMGGDPGCGALVTFEGLTRDDPHAQHGKILRLEYESYESMALAELRQLADQAMDKWSLSRVAILHRIGRVGPAEPSVVISVASAHRASAFDGCRWLIDTLKEVVPIWKKDVYEDGFEQWVNPAQPKPDHDHDR